MGEPPDHQAVDAQAGQLEHRLLVLVLQRGAGPGSHETFERQPVQADHLVAGRPFEAPVQAEDERRDHEVHRPPAGERRHLVEGPEPLALSAEVEARLLAGLPHGSRRGVGVVGLAPPPGEAHVPRPRVLLVLRAPDEEQLRAGLRSLPQDERHRRAWGVPGNPQGRAGGEGPREVLPADHAEPASASRAWAWVSHRNAMFGASSPRASRASTSAGAAYRRPAISSFCGRKPSSGTSVRPR